MNLTILPDAATEDVKDIENIIKNIDDSMKELDAVFKKIIPERLETDWANKLKENWDRFYDGTIKDSMYGMQSSANNLKRAIDAALEYNK